MEDITLLPVAVGHPAHKEKRYRWIILVLLVCVFAMGVAIVYLLNNAQNGGKPIGNANAQTITKTVIQEAKLPQIEALEFQQLSTDDARATNAAIPFSDKPNPPAHPFTYPANAVARARALDCLAAATLYEAGDDARGQQAVAQVILNRVRHPAFPNSVCGVVFQGSDRNTGCQFTFTCDGSLSRQYATAAWDRARQVANQALSGAVFKPVGFATHYHTDWVVPYWSSSLEKIAVVDTHLFFRWKGNWGGPPAFRSNSAAQEPNIDKMARLSTFHQGASEMVNASNSKGIEAIDAAALEALSRQDPSPPATPQNTTTSLPTISIDSGNDFVKLAITKCAGQAYCKLKGWADTKGRLRIGGFEEADDKPMLFSYLRDQQNGFEKALWNCAVYPRAIKRECMK